MKESIERSREFLDALKKAKDKNPDCIVRPKVTMKNKGTAAYKGTFPTVEAARNSDKVICLIPGNDGHIYEMHKTEQGEFIAPKHKIIDFQAVAAGFTPALPLIPLSLMRQIIAFFRSFMAEHGQEYEALVLIYLKECVSPAKTTPVVYFENGCLSLQTPSARYRAAIELPARSEVAFAFNLSYMWDALQQFSGHEKVRLHVLSPVSPVTITAEGTDDVALVLPVRYRAAA